jgi:hypothetical protein
MADRARRGCAGQEVNAVDQGVAGNHRELRTRGSPGGGVVADSEGDAPRALRNVFDDRAKRRDQRVFGQLAAAAATL